MIIAGILVEETHRQDNQYASLVAKLRVNLGLANRLEAGNLKVSMAFAARAIAPAKKGKKASEAQHKA